MTIRATGWTSSDWYRPGEGQLHFFQRQKVLLWVMGTRVYTSAEAWGGVTAVPGVRYPVMKPQLTTPGTYVVHRCRPYVSARWRRSRIPWGVPVKVDKDGEGVLYQESPTQRRWKRVRFTAEEIAALRLEFVNWYQNSGKYDLNRDGFPDTWIFNEFGPWAVEYFLDPNRNRKLDGKEKIWGEKIHTTPDNEVEKDWNLPVQLGFSHGCIHVKPADRDKFQALGAFNRGNLMAVHTPSEVVPEFLVAL